MTKNKCLGILWKEGKHESKCDWWTLAIRKGIKKRVGEYAKE